MRSIRVKLVLLVLISMVPALAVILYSERALRDALVRDAHDKSLMIVLGLASEYERTVESTRKLLSAIAKNPDVLAANIPRCSRLLGGILTENPMYANIFLVNSRGDVFASGRKPFKPHSVKTRKYYSDAMSTGKFSAGEYVLGVTAKIPVLHFAQPVKGPDGKVKILVVAAIDLARYGEFFPHARLPGGAVLSLLDHTGVRLYRYPGAEKYSGSVAASTYESIMKKGEGEGVFRSVGPDGVKRLSAYKRFFLEKDKAPYLFMVVGIPEKEAFSEARRVALISALLCGLALLMSIFLAWFVGRAFIVKRLRKLVRVSQNLGRGDLAVRTDMDHTGDELGQLAKSFDEMAASLENMEADRRRAEKTLQRSEEKYRSIFENAIEGIFQTTPEGKFISANRSLAEILGYDSPEDLMGDVTDIGRQLYINPEDREMIRKSLVTQGIASGPEVQLRRKDGSPVWVSLNTRLIREGDTVRFEGVLVDITERKLAEDALRESERKLADIIEFLPDATFVIDIEGKVIAWNRAVEEMTGISKKDMIGHGDHAYTVPFYGYRREQLLDLIDTDNAELESKYKNVQRRGNILTAEVFTPALYGGKGAYIWATGAPLFDDRGNRAGAIESMRDITARKQAEQLMQASLREKEVLLKEIQHRVKNNLLMISGIIALQLDQITDGASRDVFMSSMNRINAIGKMHTRIYQTEDYSRVSSRTCIMEILVELSHFLGFPGEKIEADVDDMLIDVNTAIPLGLLVNELVSNAMKHAFPPGEKGTITVTLRSGDGQMRLAVRDDGVGFPPDVDIMHTGSVGLQLIIALAEQLDGRLDIDRGTGTAFAITFPGKDGHNG